MAGVERIRPQEGYQMKALSTEADIAIGGGAAGVGKTFSLLLDPLRDIDVPDFGGVIFRRTNPQIKLEGGLWDTSMKLYLKAGAKPRESTTDWTFPKGSSIKFSHLEYEKNIFDWQGSQICFLAFDELTHFTEKMFFYLLTRNRSTCGIKPYVRATCNPDPDSWVARLIAWWIDEDTGFPIPERDGVVRFFAKDGDNYIWGDTKQEVIEKAWYFLKDLVEKSGIDPEEFIKSLTFISGSIYDNRALLSENPAYLSNLAAQDEQTRAQLLEGNWKVAVSDIDLYDYYAFQGLFTNKYQVVRGTNYITADIAGMGSNKFVIGVWDGWELIDIEVYDKSDGPLIVAAIDRLAKVYKVQNRHIAYDADGIGGMYTGFAEGAIAFHGGAPALETKDDTGVKQKEDYKNLKAQCNYRMARRVNKGEISISPQVYEKMYDTKNTVRQQFIHERKAIKRDKPDLDGKLALIPKDQMKVILGGNSPDLMDMFAIREIFELKVKKQFKSYL